MAQIPAPLRQHDEHGRVPVLVRTDAAVATHQFAAHLTGLGVQFSVEASLGHFDIHTALALLPAAAWTPAYQARKPPAVERGVQIQPRDAAWVAEVTGCVNLSPWPAGTRLILRKQRPHPSAQLRITDVDGMRITGWQPWCLGSSSETPAGLQRPATAALRPHSPRSKLTVVKSVVRERHTLASSPFRCHSREGRRGDGC